MVYSCRVSISPWPTKISGQFSSQLVLISQKQHTYECTAEVRCCEYVCHRTPFPSKPGVRSLSLQFCGRRLDGISPCETPTCQPLVIRCQINNKQYIIYIRIIMYLCKVCSVRICIKWYDIRHILKISHGLGWWRWSHHPLAPRATFQERLKVDDGALAEVLREEGGDEAEALKEAAKEAGSPKWSLASSKIPKRESLSLKRFQTWSFLQDYDPKTWVTWILFRYIRYNIYNLRNKDAHA